MRHSVEEAGVKLQVRMPLGHIAHAFISDTEAKRLAWAILADLDPEGAASAQHRRGGNGRKGVRAPSVLGQIVIALKDAPLCARELSEQIGVHSGVIAARANAGMERGLVRRIDGGSGRGQIARYSLTPQGLALFAETDQ